MLTCKRELTTLPIKTKDTTLLTNLSTAGVTIALTTILFIAYYY